MAGGSLSNSETIEEIKATVEARVQSLMDQVRDVMWGGDDLPPGFIKLDEEQFTIFQEEMTILATQGNATAQQVLENPTVDREIAALEQRNQPPQPPTPIRPRQV